MSRGQARWLHAATGLVGATGLAYGSMAYFVRSDDPFAVVNHPQQPLLQHLHVLVAPALVFGLGLIWADHVWKRVRSGHRPRRATGVWLALLAGPMAATGYAVQVIAEPSLRAWVGWSHAACSTSWLVLYVWHMLSQRTSPNFRSARGCARPSPGSAPVEPE